jgi:hypothetical protein
LHFTCSHHSPHVDENMGNSRNQVRIAAPLAHHGVSSRPPHNE